MGVGGSWWFRGLGEGFAGGGSGGVVVVWGVRGKVLW